MPRLQKPEVAAIEALRNSATKNGQVSEADWIANNIDLTAGILRNDPRRYRSYGPYWWAVKHSMINHGVDDFGDFVDLEWFEKVDYGNEFLNLLAALMYQDTALDMGLIYSNDHNIEYEPVDEDSEGDVQVYTVADDFMELKALDK